MTGKTGKEIVKEMPWRNPDPELSYGGVATFITKTRIVFAPVKKGEDGIAYCFSRAFRIGSEKVSEGSWKSYKIDFVSQPTIGWPHVVLRGKNNE